MQAGTVRAQFVLRSGVAAVARHRPRVSGSGIASMPMSRRGAHSHGQRPLTGERAPRQETQSRGYWVRDLRGHQLERPVAFDAATHTRTHLAESAMSATQRAFTRSPHMSRYQIPEQSHGPHRRRAVCTQAYRMRSPCGGTVQGSTTVVGLSSKAVAALWAGDSRACPSSPSASLTVPRQPRD